MDLLRSRSFRLTELWQWYSNRAAFRTLLHSKSSISPDLERRRPVKWSTRTTTASTGQTSTVEELWRKFFSDPSQWWDNRLEKVNSRYPDFKHKKTQESLWLNGKSNPPWVEEELAVKLPKTALPTIYAQNKRLMRCVRAGQYEEALQIYSQVQQEGLNPDKYTFVAVLNACARLEDLKYGRHIHTQIIESGQECDIFVSNSLIDMYTKCGNIEDAWEVFNKMPSRTVVTWGAMILGCVRCGKGLKALELSQRMHVEGVEPDSVIFVGVLNACASVLALEEGRRAHEQIIQRGYESDVFVGSALVHMYAKCGSIEDARGVFDKLPTRNVVSWNAMIGGHVKCGQVPKALQLFKQMHHDGLEPNAVTFVAVLSGCANSSALEQGRHVHELVIQRRYESNVFVGNSLIDMYAKCGSIEDARRIFDKMSTRNVVAWSAMILGYVKCGQSQMALELARWMQREGVEPNTVTFVGVLNACASIGALEEGRHFHEQIIDRGLESDVFVGNSLVDMYAKCGSMDDAWRVFNKMTVRNAVAWSSLILGYVKCGQGKKALELSRQMQLENVEPNTTTFVGMLNACASVSALEEGRSLHEHIIQRGCETDLFVGNSLIDMYAKCGSLEDAWRVFNKMPARNVVTWNTMIFGYVKHGQGQNALELWQRMCGEGVDADPVTFVSVLNACADLAALQTGRGVHAGILRSGWDSDIFVCSGLVDMYAKCGSVEDAESVFHKMPVHDLVSWNAMLGGYSMHGHAKEALGHFGRMCQEGVEMDKVTFISLLSACSRAGLVNEGLQYFESMNSAYGVSAQMEHYTCMVDLLGRAGRLHEAKHVIQSMSCKPDSTMWMSLLGACRVHGNLELGECIAKQIPELEPGSNSTFAL